MTYVSAILKHYLNRLTKDYLPNLREYHRCTQVGGKQLEKLLSYTRKIRQDSVGNLEELQKYIVAQTDVARTWSNLEGRYQIRKSS